MTHLQVMEKIDTIYTSGKKTVATIVMRSLFLSGGTLSGHERDIRMYLEYVDKVSKMDTIVLQYMHDNYLSTSERSQKFNKVKLNIILRELLKRLNS